MRNYVLIITYADTDEIQGLVKQRLGNLGLEVTPNVIISWRSRDEIERKIMSIKEELTNMMERGFEGEFAYAIIELSDEQFRAVRSLIVRRLEIENQRLISYGENLLKRLRSQRSERIMREYTRFDRQYRWLVMAHEAFNVKHGLLDKIMDLARELRIEFERK
ncbi:MAG: hypothetical protein TU36_006610 [Vulcanisaeta sp. AZ3]